jgi:hypothetical protein
VPGAGRQHGHVAGDQVEHLALRPAELHLGAPLRNAERFVDHRMIVDERINAVAPLAVSPAVARKQGFDRLRRVAGGFNRAFVDEHRQCRIVRHLAVVFEQNGEGCGGHAD